MHVTGTQVKCIYCCTTQSNAIPAPREGTQVSNQGPSLHPRSGTTSCVILKQMVCSSPSNMGMELIESRVDTHGPIPSDTELCKPVSVGLH